MTEIKYYGSTFVGTAEGDHGVFTRNSDGTVYAGQIANGYPCVGVFTDTSGTTSFVECDADGKQHGRILTCNAAGAFYYLYEHDKCKEHAWLCADGTRWYNKDQLYNTDCRADFAPFGQLQAKVLPIKARPTGGPPSPPLRIRPHPPLSQIGPSAMFWHSQELATAHAEKARAFRRRHQPAWAL
jgi:hypothetical protein